MQHTCIYVFRKRKIHNILFDQEELELLVQVEEQLP